MEQVAQVEACRLCANFYVTGAEVEFVHLFEPIAGLEHQLEFLHTQTNAWQLNISSNDGLPQRICANCFTQFCNIQAFHQQCVLAQQKLLQSFVGVGLTVNSVGSVGVNSRSVAAMSQQGDACHANNITNDNELLNEIKIDTPVTSADLMSSLDCLQPPTTTSADVIASLDSMQLPASVAETLSMLTQEYTTMQNNSLLDTSGNAITTHAIMDTKTEETNVLQFTAASSIPNTYYAQQTPITAVAAMNTNTVTLNSEKTEKADVDLEDMLQGSIIQKKSNSIIVKQNIYEESKEEGDVCEEDLQQSVSSLEDYEDEDMDFISCSDQDEPKDLDDLEPDADAGTPTRISRNPFACQYCYCPNTGSIDHLVFDSSDALSQHFFDVHDPNLPYTCPYCPQKYNSAKQRDYHVRLMHPSASRSDQCEYCKKMIRTPKESHEFSCQFVGDWRCETCEQNFYQVPLSRFRIHERNHTTTKQFKCRECGRVFVRRANLLAHERMHRPRSNYNIQCEQCPAVFSNDYEMRRHKYQTHNGELPVRCEYCMKGFVSMAFLSRHTQHFHPDRLCGRNSHAATCTNCGCTFSSLHKLRIHIQRPRDENGRCMETVRELAPVQDRSRQLRRPRLHACQHCNKRFSTQATLEKHLNTHEPPTFSCNECTTNFQNATELKRHVTEVHSRPRYLKCDQCDKRFFYMRELQQHVKLHAQELQSKETSLHCSAPNCGYVASSRQNAYEHTLVKHKYVACEYCHCFFVRNRLPTHLRNMHSAEMAAKEANNNNISTNEMTNAQEQQIANSLPVASIINTNVQMNNKNVMVSFENGVIDDGEKVRVELVQQHTPHINQVVLQEQTPNTFKELIPTADDEMEQSLLMGTLLDADHEIIVT